MPPGWPNGSLPPPGQALTVRHRASRTTPSRGATATPETVYVVAAQRITKPPRPQLCKDLPFSMPNKRSDESTVDSRQSTEDEAAAAENNGAAAEAQPTADSGQPTEEPDTSSDTPSEGDTESEEG